MNGGAKFTPDAIMTQGSAAFQVRAERSGAGDGRVYKITYTATNDNTGDTWTDTVTVCVPHDQSKKGATCVCNDDRLKYDATK